MSTCRGLPAGVLIAIASACSGGGDEALPIDAATDAAEVAIDAAPDASQACSAWMLVPRTARTIALHDERHPLNAARTFRLLIEYDSNEDEEPAIPTIGRGMSGLTVQPMV